MKFTGLSSSVVPFSSGLNSRRPDPDFFNLQFSGVFKYELLPLYSPSLRQSMLVCFPPLFKCLSSADCLTRVKKKRGLKTYPTSPSSENCSFEKNTFKEKFLTFFP